MPRRSGRIFGEDFGEDFRGREAGKKAGAGGTGQDEPQARTERDKADESGRDRAVAGPTEAGRAWKRVRKRGGERERRKRGRREKTERLIIGKTKCAGIQNQMRLFGSRISPKRKATKISHTHKKTPFERQSKAIRTVFCIRPAPPHSPKYPPSNRDACARSS